MPRYTLFRSEAAETDEGAVETFRNDARVHVLAEQPGMLLLETTEEVAQEWRPRLQWKLQLERRAKIPDPRPKLRVRVG